MKSVPFTAQKAHFETGSLGQMPHNLLGITRMRDVNEVRP
jgi:hypothetical protein